MRFGRSVHPFRRRPEAGAALCDRSESGILARKEGEIASRGSRGNGFPWSGGRGRKAPEANHNGIYLFRILN
jgi:hypothetical protein